MPRSRYGVMWVVSIPMLAALANQPEDIKIAGLNYTGWVWLFCMMSGAALFEPGKRGEKLLPISFPFWPWMGFVVIVFASLFWVDGGLGSRHIQDAMYICGPVFIAALASRFIRNEADLKLLIKSFYLTLPSFFLFLVYHQSSMSGEGPGGSRVASLSAVIVACVYVAAFPKRIWLPFIGFCSALLMSVATGSRMATLTMLIIPIVHPLYRTRLFNLVIAGIVLIAGIGLFYTPVMQQRFFYSGSGTLTDLMEGNFLGFGRFDKWPIIYEDAWKRPVLGHGIGSSFEYVGQIWERMNKPHNDYLRVFYELGAVGLVTWVGALLFQLGSLWLATRRSSGIVQQAFAAGFIGVCVYMVSCVTDNSMVYALWITNPLFALMGAAYGARAGERERAVKFAMRQVAVENELPHDERTLAT